LLVSVSGSRNYLYTHHEEDHWKFHIKMILYGTKQLSIDLFRYIKIQPKTINLITRLWKITAEFVGFIPQSLMLRSIV